jgi:erythronate-4-phosphate dehydrogenase
MTKSDRMVIFVDENIPYLLESLISCGKVIRFKGRELTNKFLIANNCDALFVRSTTKVNKELLQNTKVRFVGTATSGIDHIDKDYLDKSGIYFADAPGSNANSVAELVVYSIIKWAKRNHFLLNTKSIGVVGFGNIGKLVAKFASYFNMNIFVNDPPLLKAGFDFPDYLKYKKLDEICRLSDIITNHVPLTKDGDYPTYNLFNSGNLNFIRDNTLFVHTSRGFVVDETSLIQRIKSRESINAIIDVWENEPLIDKELAGRAMLSTPHIGGYSRDGKLKGALSIAMAFKEFSGLKPDTSAIEAELYSYNPIAKDKFKDLDFIMNTIQEKRNFEFDYKNLMQSLSLPENERKKAFDEIRKSYPVRRESL